MLIARTHSLLEPGVKYLFTYIDMDTQICSSIYHANINFEWDEKQSRVQSLYNVIIYLYINNSEIYWNSNALVNDLKGDKVVPDSHTEVLYWGNVFYVARLSLLF